jgi:hypothetical protein
VPQKKKREGGVQVGAVGEYKASEGRRRKEDLVKRITKSEEEEDIEEDDAFYDKVQHAVHAG